MPSKQFVVFGIYSDFPALRTGVDTLKKFGVRIADISVLLPESAVARTLPRESRLPSAVRASGGTQPGIEPLIGGTLGRLTYMNPQGRDVVSGALMSLGVPNAEADRYDSCIQNGGLLICVRSSSSDGAELAAEILARTGARPVTRADAMEVETVPMPSTRAGPAHQNPAVESRDTECEALVSS